MIVASWHAYGRYLLFRVVIYQNQVQHSMTEESDVEILRWMWHAMMNVCLMLMLSMLPLFPFDDCESSYHCLPDTANDHISSLYHRITVIYPMCTSHIVFWCDRAANIISLSVRVWSEMSWLIFDLHFPMLMIMWHAPHFTWCDIDVIFVNPPRLLPVLCSVY